MTQTTIYTFKIDDFTPESMPFGRLVEYYSEIKKMLGVAESLHLVDVVESSHGSAFKIDRNHESALTKRLMELAEGTAPQQASRARDFINLMLREDGTSASFYDSRGANIIAFPGKRAETSEQVRVRGAANFVGELYHIAGTKDDAKVRISTDAYGVVFCTTSKDIAKALRDFLFEEVKVSGRGMWVKEDSGKWNIDNFVITDFAPVTRESLRESVNRLRNMNIDWPDDPLGKIIEIEERNGTAS
ncbi:hypothetical protein [Palleronia caenipelagi]|uniref:Uncharacterized protein n=1 Tax=Palleronia caenipelagi TaxID=2489174 RepID=A0A547Q868_9RHOB|nr:hypothetical protein [Palleronia caenipelagi]TRD22561.1 hypothetical protein FEV53_03860 [Palleronia caenipelagi]